MERSNPKEQRKCDEIIYDENRGKLVIDFPYALRHPRRFLKILGPFLTAHHPFCLPFEGHTIKFRGRSWCIGCLFNSFSFIIALVGILILWLQGPLIFDRRLLLYGGIGGVIFYFLLSAFHLTENIKAKLVSKLILGISFASVCFGILIAGNDLMFLFEEKVAIILLLYMLVISILSGKRMWETYKTCIECEFKMRWSRCPGFKDLVCALIEDEYIIAEERNSSIEVNE